MGAQARATVRLIVAIGIFAPLVACNSLLGELDRIKKKYDEKNGPKPCTENCAAAPASYTIGGTVTGLAGTGLVLQNNGANNLTITANGSFTFSTPIADGASYNVTVLTQPSSPNQICSVTNGTGTVAGANVTSVAVNCVSSYTIGGTVTGLSGTLMLQNNGADDLSLASNGSFTFSLPLSDGEAYNVTVKNNPSGQFCRIDNSAGAVAGGNVTNVAVTCSGSDFTWVQDAYLKASNAEANDRFGHAVAISGSTIVVGARFEDSNQTTITNTDGLASSDNSATDSGAVYVFKRDANGDWIQDAYLKTSNAEGGDSFGDSVAISGSTIVVGAYWEDSNQTTVTNADGTASSDNSATDSGAVYVFKRDANGDWIQDAYLKASNAGSGDRFGISVAISGSTIVVGALGEDSNQTTITNNDGSASSDNGATDSGAVYVFKRDAAGNWIQDAYLKASNAEASDYFGHSVAISGSTIVVGAVYEDSSQTTITNTDGLASSNNGASYSGAVYVFKRDAAGNWIQDAYLKASNAEANDYFGSSVAISGSTIVVGAIDEDSSQTTITNTDGQPGLPDNNSASGAGAVYVFKRDANGDWIQDAYLKASNAEAYDFFGISVAISGSTIVVGAYGEDSNQTTITNSDGTASSNNSASNSGAVYVFKRDANGDWIQDAYLKASNAEASDFFGYSVAISGSTIVVGAYQEDSSQTTITNDDGSASANNSAPNSGAAYVFKLQ
jgi:ketosteroid isomerase-like protein